MRARAIVVALAAALFLVAAGEGVFRVAGIGAPDPTRPLLRYQRVRLPAFRAAQRVDGTPVLVTTDPRVPAQQVLARKPDNSLRVLAFGGSATAGLGYSPNVTFARYLERMLRAAYPGRMVEVVNLGVVALSSAQVKLLVSDACAHADPDLVLVYSGNNEFLELHTTKYVAAHASALERVRGAISGMHVSRAVRDLLRPVDEPELSSRSLRLSQREIVQDIETTPADVERVVERYGANLDEMVDAAERAGAAVVLLSVASNWRWRGRDDLPADWLAQRTGGDESSAACRAVMRELDDALATGSSDHEDFYRRAVLKERTGDLDGARADYRAAMNADPHLRRALDAMGERVGAVAARRDVPLLDSVQLLASDAPHGIVGFEHFYDYVHFRPRGALQLAAGLHRLLIERGFLAPAPSFDLQGFVQNELDDLALIERDFRARDRWLGIGFGRERLASRDLWKYDDLLDELDRRLEQSPGDVTARVYRGNARSFRAEQREDAAQDWRAALAIEELPEVRAALEALERRRLAP